MIVDILRALGTPPAAVLDENARVTEVLGVPVMKTGALPSSDGCVIIAIGDNAARERVAAGYSRFATVVHPTACVASDVEVGEGSVIMAGAVINSGSRIGLHCIVNTHATVEHDCVLNDFAHVAPGATLGGSVRIGHGAVISLHAGVIHGRTVGAYTVVGAGAVVLDDLPDQVVAYGVPARIARSRTPGEPYL